MSAVSLGGVRREVTVWGRLPWVQRGRSALLEQGMTALDDRGEGGKGVDVWHCWMVLLEQSMAAMVKPGWLENLRADVWVHMYWAAYGGCCWLVVSCKALLWRGLQEAWMEVVHGVWGGGCHRWDRQA